MRFKARFKTVVGWVPRDSRHWITRDKHEFHVNAFKKKGPPECWTEEDWPPARVRIIVEEIR